MSSKPPPDATPLATKAPFDLSVERDRIAVLREYAAGLLEVAERVRGGHVGRDRTCSEGICRWTSPAPLLKLGDAPARVAYYQAVLVVEYADDDSTPFSVSVVLPESSHWKASLPCDELGARFSSLDDSAQCAVEPAGTRLTLNAPTAGRATLTLRSSR